MLYEWRNVPRSDGYSPAQLMFGRAQRTSLPSLPSQNVPIDFPSAASSKDAAHARVKLDHDRSKLSLTSLSPGQAVHLQDSKSSAWDKQGNIISMRPDCPSSCQSRHTLSRHIDNSPSFVSSEFEMLSTTSVESEHCCATYTFLTTRSCLTSIFSSKTVPLLLSYGQDLIDQYHKEIGQSLYRTQGEYDTINRQHVRLIRDLFID